VRSLKHIGIAAAALTGTITGCERAAPPAEAPLAARELTAPAGPGSGEPQLALGPRGEVVLSWLEPAAGDDYALRYSTLDLGAGKWGPPTVVAAGANWYVNPMDMPSVQPITADVWAAHWLESSATSQFAYDIAIATSTDGGRTFGTSRRLNDDDTDAEHGFVTLFPWGDSIGAVWLDGRELAHFHQQEPTAPELEIAPVGTNLRYARVAYDGVIAEQGLVDRLACDCCQTDVAITARGPLVAYRDRTEGEIRDIAVRAHDGAAWSDPVRLGPDNWQIEGCPVNGPAIAARGATVVVAWFTAAANEPRVRIARSTDQGTNFAPPIDVDTDGAFGQVDVILANDDSAIVSWWRRNPSGGTQLSLRRITAAGELGAAQTVATSTASRPLDVPQMVVSENQLVIAWTQFGEQPLVRTLLAPL
jgi:hypothetical protein